MVREFSEEKKEEIFRILDEIDMKEWKPFMEWCGSSAEEFGDWPERLNVSAYTRYVDEYHKKVLELNEMTRQQVNTVFENVAEIDARYAERMRECQEKIKEQIATVRTMTEFMQSMTDGNSNMALITKGSVNEKCVRREKKEIGNKEMAPSICSPGSQNIDGLYRAGWISEEENQYLQCLLTTSTHVPESERVVIMGIIQYYINTRDVNSPGYQWIQENQPMLDLYLEHGELKWPEEIKQHVLSEYYDAYVKDAAPPLLTAGAASVLEVEILDWGKCQALYDRISIRNRYKYMHIIWYGKPMQLNGNSPQEQYLNNRLSNPNFSISWSQEKVDQLWEACEQIYDEYGIAIDPRFLLAIIILEGTGSFNTSSTNLAADGGHGIEYDYIQDLTNASNLIFEKTLGYICYNEQFRLVANNNSDLLGNDTDNIFTYYNWQTPIIDLENRCVRTGVYAGDYSWGVKAEGIYEKLTYEGAGDDYNQYILNLDPSVVQDIMQGIAIQNFTFSAVENGVDYKGELCGAYTIIAE